MKIKPSIFIVILLVSLCCLSFFIYQTDSKKRAIKEDLVELSNIKYGLFNVDEWKNILTDILAKKIEELDLKENNRQQMKKKITDFLHKVIGDFEEKYYEGNSGSIGGFFKNLGAKTFNVFGEMKKNIPNFTNQILDFLNDPNNKKALKAYLTDKLNEYADNTFAKMDYSIRDAIVKKHNLTDGPSTITALNLTLGELQNKINNYKYLLVLLAVLTAAYMLLRKTIGKIEFILLTSTCFIFLVLGLSLPMIEIDARIAEIKISFIGEHINFKDQVLYYKSKSIIEVIKLMLTQSSFDLLIVGFLIFVFSVLFPLSKLVASILLITSPKLQSNKFVFFLVHKTGKWSMADVMVVAIFMAYLGFSGILTEQLHQIENISSKMDVLTTNKSSLQTGFFAFTSFALLSLLLTNKLQNKSGIKS